MTHLDLLCEEAKAIPTLSGSVSRTITHDKCSDSSRAKRTSSTVETTTVDVSSAVAAAVEAVVAET